MLWWSLLYNEVNLLQVFICALPLGPPSHPLRSPQHRADFPVCYSRFPLPNYSTDSSIYIYMSVFISQCVPHSPSPMAATSPFSTSASLFLPQIQVLLYHFSRFHIYELIYDIFFLFLTSLSSTDSGFNHITASNPVSLLQIKRKNLGELKEKAMLGFGLLGEYSRQRKQ